MPSKKNPVIVLLHYRQVIVLVTCRSKKVNLFPMGTLYENVCNMETCVWKKKLSLMIQQVEHITSDLPNQLRNKSKEFENFCSAEYK
jgi:hypothetical protein